MAKTTRKQITFPFGNGTCTVETIIPAPSAKTAKRDSIQTRERDKADEPSCRRAVLLALVG